METREKLTDFLMITVGTVICAAAVFFFLIPSSLTVGSISGLAIILSNLIPLSISVITFILNVGLLLLGFPAGYVQRQHHLRSDAVYRGHPAGVDHCLRLCAGGQSGVKEGARYE